MKVFPPEKIRNVALVGHSGSGKTTLAEALLFRAGSIGRIGTVEAGSTVTDSDPEEQDRQMSITMGMALASGILVPSVERHEVASNKTEKPPGYLPSNIALAGNGTQLTGTFVAR